MGVFLPVVVEAGHWTQAYLPGSNPALVARHQPLRPLCDAKLGCTVRSRLYDDLYIVP
jgi:hypothetical protein